MSATNRSDVRDPDDHYATPPWATRAILRLLPRTPGPVLEPGCGAGNILDVLRDSGRDVVGIELNAKRAHEARVRGHRVWEGNFLLGYSIPRRIFEEHLCTFDPALQKFPLIVGNPPYSLAREFVDRSRELLAPGGTIAFLLRMGFAESIERAQWHRDHPADLKILPKRPSFCAVVSCVKASAKGGATCSYREAFAIGASTPKFCPRCGAKVKVTRSDSAVYSWWLFSDNARNTWSVLPATDDMLNADKPKKAVEVVSDAA